MIAAQITAPMSQELMVHPRQRSNRQGEREHDRMVALRGAFEDKPHHRARHRQYHDLREDEK
ncbi:MAG: hypothetical protein AUH43_01785 [Acidobacteria bacterium 13_1_40CM_65_14]|nr:MAG: hypothetical protein AUH43_01785 [Acidobacteria bacterium 13_1_40CM_65_14]